MYFAISHFLIQTSHENNKIVPFICQSFVERKYEVKKNEQAQHTCVLVNCDIILLKLNQTNKTLILCVCYACWWRCAHSPFICYQKDWCNYSTIESHHTILSRKFIYFGNCCCLFISSYCCDSFLVTFCYALKFIFRQSGTNKTLNSTYGFCCFAVDRISTIHKYFDSLFPIFRKKKPNQ